jgi:hypothetical protein
MNYLDFGTPISFGYTAQYLPQKSVTRRDWKDGHAAKFIKAWSRAVTEGKKLRVPAIDKGYHAGGKQIGWAILTEIPYKEKLRDMPEADLVAEGGMCSTVAEFAIKYFKGDTDKEVWVIRFSFQKFIIEQCLEPLNSSVVSVACDLDLSQLVDLSLPKPSKFPNLLEPYTPITFLAPQSGAMCDPSMHSLVNSIASSAAVPAKILAAAVRSRDLTAITLPSGGKCSESSMNADPLSLAGKTLRERCLADVERLLPASEWSDTQSRARSFYRQRKLEPPTCESAFLSLPTATTYPSGNGKISPAGRNRLENTLRSPATIPTPRANDGTQGYNSGKTGGINLTGYLRLPTPQNANSATLLGNLKGNSPAKKSDNTYSFIQPTESANPQVWGWMMGFPMNWCESILMPPGFLESAEGDGGAENPHPLKPVCEEKESKVGAIASITTEPPAYPLKPSPLPSELNICGNSPEANPNKALKILTSSKSDEHYTPENIISAAREVMGGIDLDPMSCRQANKSVKAAKFYTKEDDGLTKPWAGRIWLNPAFSLANEAVSKLIQSHLAHEVTEAILLIKAAPDTARHQLLAALPFCEWRGRIKFIADGNNQPAPFAVLIFYLGNNFPKFKEVFGRFGNIRLGQKQVDELESDRRDLLAKVAQLQLQLAKKSEGESKPDRRMDWLEDDICDHIFTAESRLKAWDIDHNIPHFEILSRQRIEQTARLEELKSLQKRIGSINISFFGDRITEQPTRPKLEEMEGWRSEFAVGKLAQAGNLTIEIMRYSRIKDEWICIARIREKGESYSEIGQNFYLRVGELFQDFIPYKFSEENSPSYRLGSVRTTKELKSIFPGVKIPTVITTYSTELAAPDNSIWQAFKERNTERCAIKWRCEVLPNGISRIPRIAQKNDRLEAVTSSNLSY